MSKRMKNPLNQAAEGGLTPQSAEEAINEDRLNEERAENIAIQEGLLPPADTNGTAQSNGTQAKAREKRPSEVSYALVGFTKTDAVPDVLGVEKTKGRIIKLAEAMRFAVGRNYSRTEVWKVRKGV